MPGITMSSNIRSGIAAATSCSASGPDSAAATRYPRRASTVLSKLTLGAVSSTTRMIGCVSMDLLPASGICKDLLQGSARGKLTHLPRELLNTDWFGDVTIEAGLQKPLLISSHRKSGESYHGKACRSRICPQHAEERDAVNVWQLDVEQDHIRQSFDGEPQPLSARGSFQRAQAMELQDAPCELQILRIVL